MFICYDQSTLMASTAADRYRRAKAIAFAALDLAPAERMDRVAVECGGDEVLRREALWLIAAAEDADAADEVPAALSEAAREAIETVHLEAPLPRDYRLLRRLDAGGMGVVYLAERVDGDLRQQVALKLLHVGLGHEEALARRFAAERRILASLSHPNIAHLVDGGLTAEGRPFLAMEYVEGERIDRWCERQALSFKERIELFLKVCAAVDYAHRHLVIHRDIKPANILVTADGEPKLLDFGIARLLEEDAAAPRTRTSLQALTPAYASPEQIEGHALSTATDVYSLGVVLYELVAGVRPFDHLGSTHLVSNAILAGEVPAPSKQTRRRGSEAAEDSASEPGERVAPAGRRIPADVDAIVLKAMRREPGQRYASVAELAEDLCAFLGSHPVRARRRHWLYRTQRFAWRRRGVLAAGLTFVALLVGFMLNREAQLDHIARERDRAEAEAAKAQQVSDFLTGLFRSSDPREARGAELTARELLDRGIEQVDRELAGQPEMRADMLHVLGRTYSELGLYTPAEHLLTRALELQRGRLGRNHSDVGMILGDLGMLRIRQGEYDEAREQLDEAARILEGSLGGDAPELVPIFINLGPAYRRLGEYEKSLIVLERALAIQRRIEGRDSESVASILHNMGSSQVELGALERAEDLYERALAISEHELGPDHPQVGNILMNLTNVRSSQGKLEGLEAIYQRNIDIQKGAYGAQHLRVGVALNNLGDFLLQSRRYDEAIDVLQRTLEIYGAAGGPNHPETAYPLATLGDAHLAAGRLHEARSHYRRSVAVAEGALEASQFDRALAHSLVRLGRVEAELGDRAAAEQSLNRALAIWDEAPDTVHPDFALSLLELGRWLAEQRRCPEAMPLLQRVARIEHVRQDPSSAQAAELQSLLRRCSEEQRTAVTAEPLG